MAAVVALLVAGCSGGSEAGQATSPATSSVEQAPTATTPAPAPTPPPSSPPPPSSTPTATPTDAGPTSSPAPDLDPLQGLALDQVATGLVQPVDVALRPDDGSVWVVQQGGTVVGVTPDGGLTDPLLDVSDAMEVHSIEQGLLGMAFHPDFPTDPRVFVFHSLPSNDNVLVSFEVGDDATSVEPSSRLDLLVVDKEPDKVRHNGGKVAFGPDGLLYLSLGDAARASVNGQDPSTLPGSILRLDVDATGPGGRAYGIPAGNPFADGATIDGVAGAPEVFWFGLRNPWRFSFDEPTGRAWIGDVGQETAEEVDVVPFDEPGVNFGWPAREGLGSFYDDPPVTPARDPILEVGHDDVERGCSITGGVVHRGASIPELDGVYFYADWCNGWIRSVRWDGQAIVDEQDWSDDLPTGMVSAFALDAGGEVLVVDWEAGTVARIVARR